MKCNIHKSSHGYHDIVLFPINSFKFIIYLLVFSIMLVSFTCTDTSLDLMLKSLSKQLPSANITLRTMSKAFLSVQLVME